MRFITGTYTRLGGEGVVLTDVTNGVIRRLYAQRDLDNPTYAIPTPDGRGFFTVGKDETQGEGYVARYALRGDAFSLLGKAQIGRSGACHMALSPDGNTLYTANYHSGSISVLPLTDGLPQNAAQVIDHIDPLGRAAHAHHVSFAPDDPDRLHVVDLGCDSLITYRRDRATGLLTRVGCARFPLGIGPRHLAYARGGSMAYVAHELGSKISLLARENGAWRVLQTLSTLPEDCAVPSYCAAIRVSPDETRVYVSNRGHNSIARFAVSPDGSLSPDGFLPSYGDYPRDFALLPDGDLLVANQNDGSLALVSADGALKARLETPGAVCVCPVT